MRVRAFWRRFWLPVLIVGYMLFAIGVGVLDHEHHPNLGKQTTTTTTTAPPNIIVNTPPAQVVPGPGVDTKEVIQQPTVKILHDNGGSPPPGSSTTTSPASTTTTKPPASTTTTTCVIGTLVCH